MTIETEQLEITAPETGRNLPLVAVVGRPNVGKSTLFNRLTGERKAIVGDEPGITRDRIYGEAEWNGRRFALVDTGGIVPDDDAEIPANIFKQAATAIGDAVALLWVADVRAGVTPLDEEIAVLLRGTGKRVLVAANKADAARIEAEAGEFYQFGFEDVFPISAEQGNGVGDMLEALVETFPDAPKAPDDGPREIKLAIIGRPNVGKSSLLNKLLGEERAIVSPVAGTTRDAVDTILEADGHKFRLIDTAGIRRKGKTTEMAEKLSVVMARRALERADVALVLVDAIEGPVALDANIAGYAEEAGCSIILIINKWDAVEKKETNTALHFERRVREHMKFLDFAPVVTLSALTGQRVTRLLPLVAQAHEARNRRVPTAQLNDFFERHVNQPHMNNAPGKGGRSRLHVKYLTQGGVRPPTFILFTGGGRPGLHFSYLRYMENRLREEFDFFAAPIRFKERHSAMGKGKKGK
jgi:GTP-binding protein